MKILLPVILFLSPNFVFAQIQGAIMEVVCDGDCPDLPSDYQCVRVYAQMTHATDVITTLLADVGYPMYIQTDGCFFNHELGSIHGANVECEQCVAFPSLCYDSWTTVAIDCNNGAPFFNLSGPGAIEALNNSFDIPCGVSLILEPDGELNYDAYAAFFTEFPEFLYPDEDLKILIGQFTIDGNFLAGTMTFVVYPEYSEGSTEWSLQTLNFGTVDGCTDPLACNFNAEANQEDGSCLYDPEICNGCNHPWADNYDPLAFTNDGSCTFTLSGQVFHDQNMDGESDETEEGIAGILVEVPQLEIATLTNDSGYYFFPGVEEGFYTIQTEYDMDTWPLASTPTSYEVIIGDWPTLTNHFGLHNSTEYYQTSLVVETPTTTCNSLQIQFICIKNEGNVVLYGYEVVTMDSLFTYAGSTLPVDSVVGNNVYFNFGTLYPGDMLAGYIYVWSPSEEFLGTQLCISAQAFGFSDSVQTQLVHENSETSCDYVLCSYDPNDKQVQPPGMVDSHAILVGTDLEYTIRFQNTGNAPASTVVVRDTLHTSLDISTFSTLGSTHDHSILIHTDSREVVFTFNNILLPDSATDPVGSQGTLAYVIRPLPQAEPGTLIENTAHIFFDANPAIVTNTTWHTIYDCQMLEEEVVVWQGGNTLFVEGGQFYQWFFNGETITVSQNNSLMINEAGYYTCLVSNELGCETFSEEIFISGLIESETNFLKLVPNPADEYCLVKSLHGFNNATVSVTTSDGKKLFSQNGINGEVFHLNLQGISPGLYVVQITSGDEIYSVRVVKL